MPYDTTLVADRHLLDGVARGEADALRALHQRYGESIYALVYGVLVDPGEAEEVVAETFAHLWRTAARFVATTNQSVSACLKEIARSRARGLLLAREWPERLSLPPRQGPLITMIEERSEEHTSELQSHSDLVCRLLLEKKKKQRTNHHIKTLETNTA